jgi:hypothetical protein
MAIGICDIAHNHAVPARRERADPRSALERFERFERFERLERFGRFGRRGPVTGR